VPRPMAPAPPVMMAPRPSSSRPDLVMGGDGSDMAVLL